MHFLLIKQKNFTQFSIKIDHAFDGEIHTGNLLKFVTILIRSVPSDLDVCRPIFRSEWNCYGMSIIKLFFFSYRPTSSLTQVPFISSTLVYQAEILPKLVAFAEEIKALKALVWHCQRSEGEKLMI